MPSTDLIFNYWPGWLALVVASILAFNKLVEESYNFARIWGKWGKNLHAKALARHHINLAAEQFATAVRQEVDKAREEWEQEENQAIAALNERLGTVSEVTADQSKHINELLTTTRCLMAYADYEDLWHKVLRARGARSEDGRLAVEDLPEHVGYYDFEQHFKNNPKWREWIGI